MVSRRARIVTAVVLAVVTAFAIWMRLPPRPPRTRSQWLAHHVQRLRSFQPSETDLANATTFFGDDDMDFCLAPRDGLIVIPDGTWFYVVSHSSHDSEGVPKRKRTTIGDVTLAMDRTGRFYVNLGHVCGRLQLHSAGTVRTKRDFLGTSSAVSDGCRWQPLAH